MYVGYILHLIANLSVACKRYRGILLSFVSEASRLLYANAEVVSSFNDSKDMQARGRQTSSSTPSPGVRSARLFQESRF